MAVWFEIVSLHTCETSFSEHFLRSAAGPHLTAIRQQPDCLALAVLEQPDVFGSFALAVRWERSGSPRKSREMLALADYLATQGLVDHELWVEAEGEIMPSSSGRRRTPSPRE
jgi:cytochrome c oxidase assembly factor CtaG